jgi:hypothetical protein
MMTDFVLTIAFKDIGFSLAAERERFPNGDYNRIYHVMLHHQFLIDHNANPITINPRIPALVTPSCR